MPHADDLFPTRFISARDVKKIDGVKAFTIRDVVRESGINPKTQKPDELWIVYFKEAQKGHRIRKKELKALKKGFGETTEEWIGKQAILCAVSTQVGDGVRMKPAEAAATKESA